MTINISTLFTPATQPQWLAQILTNAQTLGLSATGWQSGGIARTILAILSNVLAVSDSIISTMIQGGFLDSASTVTADPSLPPYTTGTAWTAGWLDLLAQGVYNVQRQPATFATGPITITCGPGVTPATLAPFTFHVANPTPNGPTYVNTTAITLAPNTPTTGTFQADLAGPSGNAGPGVISQTVTSILGVSVSNPGSLLGLSAQGNAAVVSLCRAKLQSLSVNGPVGAYDYFARQAGALLAAQTPPVALSSPVTRTFVLVTPTIGYVDLYVASANGTVPGCSGLAVLIAFGGGFGGIAMGISTATPHGLTTGAYVTIAGVGGCPTANGTFAISVTSANTFLLVGVSFAGAYTTGGVIDGGDLGQVDQIVQANAVPDAITARTHSATTANVNVVLNVWVPAAQAPAAQSAVTNALATYFASVPIGGSTDPGGGYTNALLYDSVLGAVFGAVQASGAPLAVKQATMTLNSSAPGVVANITLLSTDVPVLFPAPTVVVHGVLRMARQGLRDLIKTISPTWLQTGVAEKLLYTLGLDGDALLEKLNQGMRAHIPGQGDTSALPLLGSDRLLTQGFNESAASFGARLSMAFDDWSHAGNARSVLRQVLAYVSPPQPNARYVSQSSVWDEYLPGDNTAATAPRHYLANNWNWDKTTRPMPAQSFWRRWLILYSTASTSAAPLAVTGASNSAVITITTGAPHGLVTGNAVVIAGVLGNTAANGTYAVTAATPTTFTLLWGPAGNGAYTSGGTVTQTVFAPAPAFGTAGVRFGDPTLSIGFAAPAAEFAAMRQIARLWKSASTYLVAIIVSFDDSLFNSTLAGGSAGLPDGQWGLWGKEVAGVRVPSRSPNARYLDGTL